MRNPLRFFLCPFFCLLSAHDSESSAVAALATTVCMRVARVASFASALLFCVYTANGQFVIPGQIDSYHPVGNITGSGQTEILVQSHDAQNLYVSLAIYAPASKGLQVSWTATNVVYGGWGMSPTDQYYPVGDLEGTGKTDILVDNSSDLCIGVLRWNGTGLQLVWAAANSVYGGWGMSAIDQYYAVGDLEGTGKTDILVENSSDLCIGVLRWNGTGLQLVWATANSIYGGWGMSADDQYRALGNIEGSGKADILVENSSDLCIGVLRWNGTGLQLVWAAANSIYGGWDMSAADRYYAAGDIEGTRKSDILVENSSDLYVGVLRWNGSGLQLVWASSQGSIYGGWQIGASDRYYAAGDIEGTGKCDILVNNTAGLYLGVLRWNGTGLQLVWATQGSIYGSWGMSAADQYYALGSLDGSQAQILVESPGPGEQWVGLLKFSSGGFIVPWVAVTEVTISGQVLSGAAAVVNVTMNVAGTLSLSTQTDSNGTYLFSVPAYGSYTVTPSLSGYSFTPASRPFNIVTANQIATFTVASPDSGVPNTANPSREYIYFNGHVIALESPP